MFLGLKRSMPRRPSRNAIISLDAWWECLRASSCWPVYLFLERSPWKKLIVIFSLILSLSRTVWVGLLFSQCITSLIGNKKPDYLKLLGGFSLSLLAILIITYFLGFHASFLFDQNLGGRIGQLEAIHSITVFPDKPFGGFNEIVYLSVLSNFGIVGVLTYLLCMFGPFFLAFARQPISLPRKRILCGLLNFLFISMSDGALLYIPVLVFYWCLSTLVLRHSFEFISSSPSLR